MTTYMITYKRKGECNFRACSGACCRALNKEDGNIINDNDSDRLIPFTKRTCSQLRNDGLCLINRNKPSVCSGFPESPWDLIYLKVEEVCSYWFEIEITEIENPYPSEEPSHSPIPSPEYVDDLDIDNGISER